MKKLSLNYAGIVACSLVLFFAACNEKKNDDQIQADITQVLSANNNYTKVTSSVKDGIVTISGQCNTDHCGDSVVAKVSKIEGVKDVVNHVEQIADQTDFTLRTSVQSIISRYQGVQADVAGGVIVLRGTIQRDMVQPLINELTMLKATKIDNQLAINN